MQTLKTIHLFPIESLTFHWLYEKRLIVVTGKCVIKTLQSCFLTYSSPVCMHSASKDIIISIKYIPKMFLNMFYL